MSLFCLTLSSNVNLTLSFAFVTFYSLPHAHCQKNFEISLICCFLFVVFICCFLFVVLFSQFDHSFFSGSTPIELTSLLPELPQADMEMSAEDDLPKTHPCYRFQSNEMKARQEFYSPGFEELEHYTNKTNCFTVLTGKFIFL